MRRFAVLSLLVSSYASAQVAPDWVTVVDPRENAFSLEVPKAWKIIGGMFRFGLIDARPFVGMTSPDGKIDIRLGDPTIPSYNAPNPWLQSLHAQGPHVAPYASGDVFATKYGLARFASMCEGVRMTKAGPLPPKFGKPGQGLVRVTAGAAGFACSSHGEQMTGYVYAETLFVGTTGPAESKWYVIALGSVLAPAAQAQMAGEILKHSTETIALNPVWAKTQGQLIAQATMSLLNIAEATRQATIAQAQRQKQIMREQAREVDNFNDVILGQSFTRDPQTGKEYVVPIGAGGAKWVDVQGTIAESAMSPGEGFHQLQLISR